MPVRKLMTRLRGPSSAGACAIAVAVVLACFVAGGICLIIFDGLRHQNTLFLGVTGTATNQFGTIGYAVTIANTSRKEIAFSIFWDVQNEAGEWQLSRPAALIDETISAGTARKKIMVPAPPTRRPFRACAALEPLEPSHPLDRYILAPIDSIFQAVVGERVFFPGEPLIPSGIVNPTLQEMILKYNVDRTNRLSQEWLK